MGHSDSDASSHFTQIPTDAHEDHFVVECVVESFNLPMAMSAMYCDCWQEIPKTVDKRGPGKAGIIPEGWKRLIGDLLKP